MRYVYSITYQKEKSILKCFGVLFTCLVGRAIHIEMIITIVNDAFILALWRFILRRGEVNSIRSDNISNIFGGERKLEKCMEELNHQKIS